MGLDNYTRVIYGWKVDGSKNVKKFEKALEKINKNYYEDYCDFFVDDTVCGNYIYFGADLVNYDAHEEEEIILNSKLIKEATDKYHKFLKEHPELDEFLNKQIGKLTTSKDAQLYVFQQIC